MLKRTLKAAAVLMAAAAVYLAMLGFGATGYQLGYEDGSRSCENDASSSAY
jgi:hypothetical protein